MNKLCLENLCSLRLVNRYVYIQSDNYNDMGIIMGKSKVEKRGRVLIPKKIRDKINLRGGEEVSVELKDGKIILKPLKSLEKIRELRGCVEESKIDPLEIKKMWEM